MTRNSERSWVKDLLGVKKAQHYVKTDISQHITIQESSEMVGWVTNSGAKGNTPSNKFIVSQDANQVFLTIAKVDPGYQEYLGTGNLDGNPFLRMQQFGPWIIQNAGHVTQLATAILAITLLESGDCQGDQESSESS
ncbi:hypothetical protein PHISP_07369 [Aspergillus sp. HF37]|nr:hypothetical protein PHISP_07369 [Aspergillus sp. HF37]